MLLKLWQNPRTQRSILRNDRDRITDIIKPDLRDVDAIDVDRA